MAWAALGITALAGVGLAALALRDDDPGTSERIPERPLPGVDAGRESHHDVEGFYELVADGVQFERTCFTVTVGNQPLDPDSTHVALVGFDVPTDVSTGELALDIDVGSGATRLALRADEP